MHICHVTPHLPPDQAANALLPVHLGRWAREAGDTPTYVSHPPRAPGRAELPGSVVWVPSHHRWGSLARATKLAAVAGAWDLLRRASGTIARADLVHAHGNGLLVEWGAAIASTLRKPVVLTLYGTEVWHYRPRRYQVDLFTRAYRRAHVVTFYSRELCRRAGELGLDRPDMIVAYPPVDASFAWHDTAQRDRARGALQLDGQPLLLNVKRLHPLAGQEFLIDAMPEILRVFPAARLVICGTGPLESPLRSRARALGVEPRVTFAGLVDNAQVARYCGAADLFVLPSLLEACPTVALEALASGTPVVAADSPGGLELHELFGTDVAVVPRRQVGALAAAVVGALGARRRAAPSTARRIAEDFRSVAVAGRYRDVYRRARELGAPGAPRPGSRRRDTR